MHRLIQDLLGPFRDDHKVRLPLVVLFLLINGLVFANALLHDPYQGYDARDHVHYIRTLAEKKQIPTCKDTAQCYIPPLPYMLPAIILTTGRITLWQAAKLAQLDNVLLSLGLTYYLLKICDLIDPKNSVYKFSALAMLGILPVYYKTFALIRGETYLAFLAVFIAYQVLSIFLAGRQSAANLVILGTALGLAVLARQWGLLIFPAVFIFVVCSAWKDKSRRVFAAYAAAVCLLIPVVVAGWYYYIMYQRYGTLTAWDRPASKLSLTVFPAEFYFGLGSGKLFTDPVRPSFSNQFPAIFYSDIWGDYSAYFLIYARDKRTGDSMTGKDLERIILANESLPDWVDTNRYTINTYLGQVNFVSLLPSVIFAAGLIYATLQALRLAADRSSGAPGWGAALFTLIIACSLAGYGWYLLRYQNNGRGGDLIKAVHMLQIFPFFGLLAGGVLLEAWKRGPKIWLGIMLVLALIFLYNLPAMITHYVVFP